MGNPFYWGGPKPAEKVVDLGSGGGMDSLLAALWVGSEGRVIGVDWNDGLSGARAFIRSHAWTFTNVREAEGTVGSAYRLTGLPTTFAVDAHGRIRAMLRGPQDQALLARALKAAGS